MLENITIEEVERHLDMTLEAWEALSDDEKARRAADAVAGYGQTRPLEEVKPKQAWRFYARFTWFGRPERPMAPHCDRCGQAAETGFFMDGADLTVACVECALPQHAAREAFMGRVGEQTLRAVEMSLGRPPESFAEVEGWIDGQRGGPAG